MRSLARWPLLFPKKLFFKEIYIKRYICPKNKVLPQKSGQVATKVFLHKNTQRKDTKSIHMLYDNFELYFPMVAKSTITYEEISDYDLVATMHDGRQMLYNDTNHTIRKLPRNSEAMTEEECRYEFGIRLRHIMFRKGVTQEELADRLDIAQGRISRYLNGRVTPNFYMVDRIAKALDCSVDEFRYI